MAERRKSKKKVRSKKSMVADAVEVAERYRQEQTQVIFDRITAVLSIAIERWEQRVKADPAFMPTPSDIASIMAARRSCADTLMAYSRVDTLLAEASAELESLENRLLGILTQPPPE